jgi:hypothetical protein
LHCQYACFAWVVRLEDNIELFKRLVLGLDEEEVHECSLECVPERKKCVEPIADLNVVSFVSLETSIEPALTLERAIGPTKVFKKPAAPAVNLKTPIPLALILLLTTSAGYIGCIGVNPTANVAPKRNMNTIETVEAVKLSKSTKAAEHPVTIAKQAAITEAEVINILRRPTTSWRRAPIVEKTHPTTE